MKRLTFELAARARTSCLPIADLDAAAKGSHLGLFFNQGQCCCAGSRVFVEESVHDEFVERIAKMNPARKLGDPLDPTTEQGPQVDKAQFDKIMDYIERGTKQGAKCVTGGTTLRRHGLFH